MENTTDILQIILWPFCFLSKRLCLFLRDMSVLICTLYSSPEDSFLDIFIFRAGGCCFYYYYFPEENMPNECGLWEFLCRVNHREMVWDRGGDLDKHTNTTISLIAFIILNLNCLFFPSFLKCPMNFSQTCKSRWISPFPPLKHNIAFKKVLLYSWQQLTLHLWIIQGKAFMLFVQSAQQSGWLHHSFWFVHNTDTLINEVTWRLETEERIPSHMIRPKIRWWTPTNSTKHPKT